MGRRPVRGPLKEARVYLAGLIDAALKAGQRGDGSPPRQWQPWTERDFAAAANASISSVNDWRDLTNPVRPGNITPLLKAFYGDIRLYETQKDAMLTAWRRAGGIDAIEQPDRRAITRRKFSEVVQIVSLLVNQPTPRNDGTLLVPFTLKFLCDKDREIRVTRGGKTETVTIDIGLTKALFAADSKHWMPSQETIFRGKPHPNVEDGPDDSVSVIRPADEKGRLVGQPLREEPTLLFEPCGTDDGPIALSVWVPRGGFKVTRADGVGNSALQDMVLEAIFATVDPRRDPGERVEVERAVVPRKVVRPDP